MIRFMIYSLDRSTSGDPRTLSLNIFRDNVSLKCHWPLRFVFSSDPLVKAMLNLNLVNYLRCLSAIQAVLRVLIVGYTSYDATVSRCFLFLDKKRATNSMNDIPIKSIVLCLPDISNFFEIYPQIHSTIRNVPSFYLQRHLH